MASDSISFTVSFRGVPHALSISPATSLAELHLQLEELTGVPPALQKLLYKNKKSSGNNDIEQMTISESGLKNGIKVRMLGSTTQDLDGLRAVENEHGRVERILRERALKAPVKVSPSYSRVINWKSLLISSASIKRFWSHIIINILFIVPCLSISFPQPQSTGTSSRSFVCPVPSN